jgi:hypothetical protein
MNTTTAQTASREAAYERFIAEDIDGLAYARRAATPDAIARYHGGPVSDRDFGKLVANLGRVAATGPMACEMVAHVITGLHRWGSAEEMRASAWKGLVEFLSKDSWTDVAGRYMGGRHKDHEKSFSTWHKLLLTMYLQAATGHLQSCVPGFGWAMTRAYTEHSKAPYVDGWKRVWTDVTGERSYPGDSK